MCGIVGIVVERQIQKTNNIILLHRMAEAIAHRGPDDAGFFETLTSDNRHFIGLGHRRLSIIDLNTGHQPIGNENGSVQIIFNGEIYNFQELRNDLIKRGHSFRTASDTETIVHAYEEYGESCVERLRGMFSFAIWDSNHEKLFLARDRFGKKPLFLYQKRGVLLFASEIKALLEYPKIQKKVDLHAIWNYLAYRYVPGPATLFEGIRKLPPGSFAVWQDGELREEKYYSPPDQQPLIPQREFSDPIDGFLALLDECVRIRMVSDVPFGAFLSGGIDSSAVVGLMSRYSNLPIKTFSVGFEESAYSELDYARLIATEFKTEHYELKVSQNHLMDELPALVRFRDAPIAEPSDIPIYLLSKEARRIVKMVLTGEGSDEFLGGYPKHIFERHVRLYQIFPYFLRHGVFESIVNMLPYKFRRHKTAIINLGIEKWETRMPRWFGALSPNERQKLVRINGRVSEETCPIQFDTDDTNSALRRILYFDQTSWLPDNLLERGDRMTMAASLEARMPFMDHKLAEFVSALPDNYRVRGFQTKWILREAMKQLLPISILNRPKIGFRVPVNEWFRDSMKDYLCDYLLGLNSKTLGYYEKKALNQIIQEHIKGRQNHEKLLWMLLNLEIWHREYNLTA
ncbi:MAG: asparagine synthase (glutamine-hydrolyzing) [Balneolaceae bacterium]|nr:asparagine synthase (glutamine-hydrolyzing) [Balneolaceae bacterium]